MGTHDKFILFGVVGNLRDGNGAGNIAFLIGSKPYVEEV
jgi:hypothetical protein